jgi:hypothetical protein
MTELDTLFDSIDANLHAAHNISEQLCRECKSLAPNELAAFQSVFRLLGCGDIRSPGVAPAVVPQFRRVRAARLLLLRLKAHTDEPAWSSFMLEQTFDAAMSVPGSEMGDVILALHDVLGEHRGSVTGPTAELIMQVIVGAFSRNRTSYEASDLSRLRTDLLAPDLTITSAQGYLALNALPDAVIQEGRDRILTLLSDTRFAEDARKMLEPDAD